MVWREDEQRVSIEEAVGYIQNGMRVVIGPGCGEPRALLMELKRQAERFDRLEVVGGIACDGLPILDPGLERHFHFITWHVTSGSRKAVAEGRASYLPLRYSEVVPTLMPGGPLRADVIMCVVSPMDSSGFVSLGPSVSYMKPLMDSVPLIIAEQNPRVPWTLGESIVERQLINALVYSEGALAEYPAPAVSQVERAIARYVGELIPDGATLQIGVGSIPEAILDVLPERRDLAAHSIITDHMIPLFERGVITARRKNIRPGRCDVGELMGTEKLMRFADRNPLINMMPATETHDPRKIALLDNFIAINSALQIDLSGQVNSEGFGERVFAAVGGQPDFVLGSQWSRGGKSIFALPSASKPGGSRSRIVARFEPGTPVSTPRHMVEYVVTEYGIAALKGQSIKKRARALINIAHPIFREELEKSLAHPYMA